MIRHKKNVATVAGHGNRIKQALFAFKLLQNALEGAPNVRQLAILNSGIDRINRELPSDIMIKLMYKGKEFTLESAMGDIPIDEVLEDVLSSLVKERRDASPNNPLISKIFKEFLGDLAEDIRRQEGEREKEGGGKR